jgi:hypothetical protein
MTEPYQQLSVTRGAIVDLPFDRHQLQSGSIPASSWRCRPRWPGSLDAVWHRNDAVPALTGAIMCMGV